MARVGERVRCHYSVNRGFYGLADMLVMFREELDETLNFKTSVWQDDVVVLTRGSAENTKKKYQKSTVQPEKLNLFVRKPPGADLRSVKRGVHRNRVPTSPHIVRSTVVSVCSSLSGYLNNIKRLSKKLRKVLPTMVP